MRRREELVTAARRVIGRDGFAAATVGTITREAGASLGLLNYHFGSKDEVVAEAFAAAAREDLGSLEAISRRFEDPAERLAAYLDQSEWEDTDSWRLWVDAWGESVHSPLVRDTLVARRHEVLAAAHAGHRPDHLPPSEATEGDWRITLPAWCLDQRNQMTGPADDAELVVKMLNSGAPGVMLDLEDSIVNSWDHVLLGVENVLSALRGELTYFDRKRAAEVAIRDSDTVILVRPRGLHIGQAGVVRGEVTPASLLVVAPAG